MERIFTVFIVAVVAVLGILIVGFGRDTGYVLHGWIIVGFSLFGLKHLLDTWHARADKAPYFITTSR